MALLKGEKTLFREIVVALTIITIVFWILTFAVARQFLKNAMWSEFTASTSRTIGGVARQTVNDIKYSDYFQIQRNLQGFYDPNYMNYITVYTSDGGLLAMFPRQVDGELYMFMEKQVLANAEKPFVEEFMESGDGQTFHFQQQIKDENDELIGFIAIGGTTKQLERVLWTQTVFFTILGFFILVIQITALGYVSRVLTRPLKELTVMLKKNEEIEPEKFLPTFASQAMPKGASSEVNLFYSVYSKLLQNIHAHIMHSQEMAVQVSLGKISSHIAHDLRSPISVVKGFVECMDVKDDQDLIEYKAAALGSIEKMNQMANELVDYAKAKQIQASPTKFKTLVDKVAGSFTEVLKNKGATLSVECPNDLAANADGPKLDRVLTNLLQNSIQAVAKIGGKVAVVAKVKKSGWLQISVEDNGLGIKEEHLPRVFDSTFTFGKPQGSGLGLSFCRNVVEAHGGRIYAESSPGKGSRFIFEIPMTSVGGASADQGAILAGKAVGAIPDSAHSILVVDDDANMLTQWKALLKEMTPFEIVTANGPDGMKEVDPRPERFRAAICDYRFEGEDTTGLDLIEDLKKRGIPCRYLCTGFYYDPALREKAVSAGAHAIIPKPIPEGLVRQLFG